MSKRMRLTVDAQGEVEIAYTEPITEDFVTRRFLVTRGDESSYVWERLRGERAQVCDGLAHRGNALRSTRDGLPNVIRREYRAMVRDCRQYLAGAR